MLELQEPLGANGCRFRFSTIADLPSDPLLAAKELFRHVGKPEPGEYILIDNRSGFRHPLTKQGRPSKKRKWVTEEIELGRWTAEELREVAS